MKYYILAGEASGDIYGAQLIKDLHLKDDNAEIYAWGGDMMAETGTPIRKHIKDLAFMGFIEVVKKLRTISKNFTFCKKDIIDFKTDALILIDYPGFNLRMAEWAHTKGIKVYYYISPQLWAWKSKRIKKIRSYVDKLFVILPFEKNYYTERDLEVTYVGHPMVDVIQAYNPQPIAHLREQNSIIAILPGSRDQEIDKILPRTLPIAHKYPQFCFVIAGAPNKDKILYQKYIDKYNQNDNIEFVANRTYDLLSQADAALVASGTATLETALFNVPQVVCYYGSAISIAIARRVIKIKYISLVNLILDKIAVVELIQNDLNSQRLQSEFEKIAINQEHIMAIKADYQLLKDKLNKNGASNRVATLIYEDLVG